MTNLYTFLYNLLLICILFGMFYTIAQDNQCTQEEINTAVAQSFVEYLELEGYVTE